MMEMNTLVKLLNIFLLKLWLTFSKHPISKMLFFFGFLENEQAKGLDYLQNCWQSTFALNQSTFALARLLYSLDSHYLECALLAQ